LHYGDCSKAGTEFMRESSFALCQAACSCPGLISYPQVGERHDHSPSGHL